MSSSSFASTTRHCVRAALRTAAAAAAAPATSRPAAIRPHLQGSFHRQTTRPLSTSHARAARTPERSTSRAPPSARPASNPDRGPASKEDTQTDFSALDVLGGTPAPTTSVDVCLDDGFLLDSGLRIRDGDGVLLLGAEAFVWRPWMAAPSARPAAGILSGTDVRLAQRDAAGLGLGRGTGGIVDGAGRLDVADAAWALFAAVAPRPDLIIVGTGASIRPLTQRTRQCLQELGLRVEVLDTRNAASQFNLPATERSTDQVAAALLPVGFGR